MEGGRNNGVRDAERCTEMRTGDIGHFELERGGRRVERGRGVLSAVLCHERHLASIAEATAGEHPQRTRKQGHARPREGGAMQRAEDVWNRGFLVSDRDVPVGCETRRARTMEQRASMASERAGAVGWAWAHHRSACP